MKGNHPLNAVGGKKNSTSVLSFLRRLRKSGDSLPQSALPFSSPEWIIGALSPWRSHKTSRVNKRAGGINVSPVTLETTSTTCFWALATPFLAFTMCKKNNDEKSHVFKGRHNPYRTSGLKKTMSHSFTKGSWKNTRRILFLLPVGSNSFLSDMEDFSCLDFLSTGSLFLLRMFGVLQRQRNKWETTTN